MGIRSLEAAILRELRVASDNYRIRHADIMEWEAAPIRAQEGEMLYYLPDLKIHVAVKLP